MIHRALVLLALLVVPSLAAAQTAEEDAVRAANKVYSSRPTAP